MAGGEPSSSVDTDRETKKKKLDETRKSRGQREYSKSKKGSTKELHKQKSEKGGGGNMKRSSTSILVVVRKKRKNQNHKEFWRGMGRGK